MKCHTLFSEIRENISKCRLLKFLPRVLGVKWTVFAWFSGKQGPSVLGNTVC